MIEFEDAEQINLKDDNTWKSKQIWNHSENCGKKKEGRSVLFNDALNTFYLWLYGKVPVR